LERKYYIEADDGRRLIIGLVEISQYRRKVAEYEVMVAIHKIGLEMPKPMGFGTCSNNTKVLPLLDWVERQSLEALLPLLDTQEQYELGVAAGKILKNTLNQCT